MKKGKFEKKISRRILSGLLALLMVVSGICTTWKINEAQASESTAAHAVHYDTISAYRGSNPTAPKPTDEAYKNWIFAGWYEEETLVNALTSAEANAASETGAWAKFVPAEILSVKGQVNNNPSTADSVKLRLVTTIDNDQYSNVGFNISIPALNGYSADYPMDKAYEKIVAAEDSVKFEYEPSVFHTMSTAFATAIITNISKANFDMGICVTPYWITIDGTRVDGVGRYLRANDVLGTTVNVPVRLYSDTAVTAGSLTVNYDADTFSYLGVDNGNAFTEVSVDTTTTAGKAVCTVTGQNATADGMLANIRFQLKDGVTLLNRAAFDAFTITAEDAWNASYVVYTSIEALTDVIPDNLPSNASYEVKQRVGLEGTETTVGTCSFAADTGVFGSALQFAPYTGTADGSCTVKPSTPVEMDDVTGVMFYVNFSGQQGDTYNASGYSATVTLLGSDANGKTYYYRSKLVDDDGEAGVGYYYDKNGNWQSTKAIGTGNDRMSVPDQFEGWVYIPLTSYVAHNLTNYPGVPEGTNGMWTGATLTSMTLYSYGSKETDKYTVYDEILLVKAPVLSDITPANIPDSDIYEVDQRVGLDGTENVIGNKYNGGFVAEEGVHGGALQFASGYDYDSDGDLDAGECTVVPKTAIDLEGVKGVLFHVDLSKVTASSATAKFGASVALGGKDSSDTSFGYRSYTAGLRGANDGTGTGTGKGYYYKDGEWVSSNCLAYNNARIQVPQNFEGWMYIPLSSFGAYTGATTGIVDEDGLGCANVTVTNMTLFTSGYTAKEENDIIFDEILFVKGTSFVDVIPTNLPDGSELTTFSNYDVYSSVGLERDEAITVSGAKYWGHFTEDAGVYGSALSFASGVYEGASGSTTAYDPNTYTGTASLTAGECTVKPTTGIDIAGTDGVLWYVDFSDVTRNTNYGYGLCSSITLVGKIDTGTYTQRSFLKENGGQAYYYCQNEEGEYEWTATTASASNSCRIKVPDGFQGWIYVPFTSYVTTSTNTKYLQTFVDDDGKALEGATVTSMSLYTQGYQYDSDAYITYDEILFVKKK